VSKTFKGFSNITLITFLSGNLSTSNKYNGECPVLVGLALIACPTPVHLLSGSSIPSGKGQSTDKAVVKLLQLNKPLI